MAILTRTWTILVLLTAVSLWAGRGGSGGSLGPLGAGLVLAAANFKADQILTHYLDLQRAESGWRTLFRVLLTLLGATIFGIYALSPMIGAALR
ncbi:cytochrome C oxidase subunit IV family protein [Azospirillum isscasi]|uniref:Cytochrome C oxidase subunit IV family protein n=1 Tax=Azospirillum isscasi TaxID=3053926 RepID=A0ABU0WJE0_9PROT|nr:cytochrome C oxidase subunit IV family protein [Azospirillum isscasi]MDQ2104340.1 cytochrome C oxidase subunit IV family protein [Azospirillum isscasi]